jgi:hypothetical protein
MDNLTVVCTFLRDRYPSEESGELLMPEKFGSSSGMAAGLDFFGRPKNNRSM